MILPYGHVSVPLELGKRFCFARVRPRAPPRHVLVSLETAQAFINVGDEARLAELAVVDDVDAEIDLLAHDLGDRGAQPRRVRLFVDGFALLSGLHDVEQIGGTRQTADMGGENSARASLHGFSLLPIAQVGIAPQPPPLVSPRSLRA